MDSSNSDDSDATVNRGWPGRRALRRVPVLRALRRDGKWSRADTLSALALLVTFGLGSWQLFAVPSAQNRPDLGLDKIEIVRSADIAGVELDEGGQSRPTTTSTSLIDVTLRNQGSAPALIVDAEADFDRVTTLQNCVGAGPGVVSAQYDITVPNGEHPRPFIVHRDMRFVVGANSIDRLQLTVGPKSFGLATWPSIYQLHLWLVEDSGKRIDAGHLSLLELLGGDWNKFAHLGPGSPELGFADCFLHDVQMLNAAIAVPGLHSPELVALTKEGAGVLAAIKASCPGVLTANGCEQSHPYLSDPVGVTNCTSTIEVSSSSNCDVANAVVSAYGTGLAAKALTVRWGLLVLPMECVPSGDAEVCRSTDSQNLAVGFRPA